MNVQAVILAAGMGSRLGKPWPKPLTPLRDGRTIMQQRGRLAHAGGHDHGVAVADQARGVGGHHALAVVEGLQAAHRRSPRRFCCIAKMGL